MLYRISISAWKTLGHDRFLLPLPSPHSFPGLPVTLQPQYKPQRGVAAQNAAGRWRCPAGTSNRPRGVSSQSPQWDTRKKNVVLGLPLSSQRDVGARPASTKESLSCKQDCEGRQLSCPNTSVPSGTEMRKAARRPSTRAQF